MAVINRFEIENGHKTQLNQRLELVELIKTKCSHYFDVQPCLSQFFRPAKQLIGHRLELLKWLLTSINRLEIELDFNNQIMERYSLLEEEVEEVCLIVKLLFDSKCLDAETHHKLIAARCEFDRNYSKIWANRQKSDEYFLEHLPRMSDQLTGLLPVGLVKSSSPSQSEELIAEFLTTIATFEDETHLRKAFAEFFEEIKKFNDFLNDQYESDSESIKTYLELGNSFDMNKCFLGLLCRSPNVFNSAKF